MADQESVNPTLEQARALRQERAWPKACACYVRVLDQDPGHGVAAFELAEVLFRQMKQTERALQYYDLAMRLDPDNDEPVRCRAEALLSIGRLADAKQLVEHYLATPALTARGWLRKGIALQTHARYPDAEKAYGRAAAAVKTNRADFDVSCQAMFHLADLYGWLDRDEDAARWFAAYLRLKPDDPEALRGYAGVLNALKRNADAVTVLQRYMKVCPYDNWPLLTLARIAGVEQREFEPALEWLARFERAEDRRPAQALASQVRGEIEEARGDLKAAAVALEKSISLNDRDPHSYYCLARVLKALGQTARATKMAQAASDLGLDQTTYAMALERMEASMVLLTRDRPFLKQTLRQFHAD